MSAHASSRFPLDFERLQRGDFLAPEEVEAAVLTDRNSQNYWRKQLALRDEIVEWFRTNRGDVVTVVCDHFGMRILTHQEQAEYAPRRERHGIKQVLTAAAEGAAVDLLALSDDARKSHERWLMRSSWRRMQLMKPPPPRLVNDTDPKKEDPPLDDKQQLG